MSDIIRISAPASKSMSHRALIAAGISLGDSHLTGVLESDDTQRTMDVLRAGGVRIERTAPGEYTVSGVLGVLAGGATEPIDINMGESGTTCRLLTGVLACGNGQFLIRGEGRMHERPIGELNDALKQLGTEFDYIEKDGYPPFIMRAAGLLPGTVTISMEESSQYLSSLLLSGPIVRKPIIIELGGEKAVSWPYVGLTLQVMEDFGTIFVVDTKNDAGEWVETDWRTIKEAVPGQVRFRPKLSMYYAQDMRVEGDWSNASYFLAAGALGDKPVRVEGLRADSLQGDRAMVDILIKMGARVEFDGDAVTVYPSELNGIEVDMGACPDLVPTVAVLATCAKGRTTITNVAHLRIKESDRIAAPAEELTKVGATIEPREDGMVVTPSPELPGSMEFSSHGDHRIAMSLSVLGVRGVKASFDDPSVVAKSFPGFFDEWKKVVG